MGDETLFPLGAGKPAGEPEVGKPRIQRPVRNQVEAYFADLESLVGEDHPVRVVWGFVEKSDLSALLQNIRSADGRAGRPAIDPRILLTLWLHATLDGIGSARALEKLCSEHAVYRWICGGVSVNYHSLADFRSETGEFLDDLLTEMVATLRSKNLVSLNCVAHDGVRVRAHAGKSSFRRRDTLGKFLAEAEAQVQALKAELHDDPGASERRRKAARERAARERLERIQEALAQYPDIKKKKKSDKEEARASTTDPDARTMRMADGGFRPAYNVQITTDPASQIILGVDVSKSGSDEGLLLPAVEQIQQRYSQPPKNMLADGGYAKKTDIETIAETHGCKTYTPVPQHKKKKVKRVHRSRLDTPHVAEWRKRMETDEAKSQYKLRAQTECVHALARNRGLQQLPVRGQKKAKAVALLYAIAHNVMRITSLTRKAA
jgi:transposase